MSLANELFRDRRVVLYVAAVALAIVFIGFFGLKFGLDLEGGSYLQLQLQGAVAQVDVSPEEILKVQFNATTAEKHGDSYVLTVAGQVPATLPDDLGYAGAKMVERENTTKVTIVSSPETVITNYLKKSLDADVKIVGVAPVQYEIRANVTRDSLNAILAPVGGSVPAGEDTFVEGVVPDTVDETKKVLDSKLNRLGLQDIKVRIVDNKFILIDLAGMDVTTAQDVVGKPGKFEIRIQTEDNQSMHVLYGDAVESVDIPQGDRSGNWGVPLFSRKKVRRSSRRQQLMPGPQRIQMLIPSQCIWTRTRSSAHRWPLSWPPACRSLRCETWRRELGLETLDLRRPRSCTSISVRAPCRSTSS